MKKLVFAILTLVIFSLAACSSITTPVAITDNPVGPKTGEVTATIITTPLGFIVISGDVSYSKAASNGGITKIATVEQRIEASPFSVKLTTIVTGN